MKDRKFLRDQASNLREYMQKDFLDLKYYEEIKELDLNKSYKPNFNEILAKNVVQKLSAFYNTIKKAPTLKRKISIIRDYRM